MNYVELKTLVNKYPKHVKWLLMVDETSQSTLVRLWSGYEVEDYLEGTFLDYSQLTVQMVNGLNWLLGEPPCTKYQRPYLHQPVSKVLKLLYDEEGNLKSEYEELEELYFSIRSRKFEINS
ncbi:coil containing protein [Vibrio phage 1.063.O._10N.261.45.C7]|nr:coil containing protein [Vibrio phage 1.063.O._10N.261.45.C7]